MEITVQMNIFSYILRDGVQKFGDYHTNYNSTLGPSDKFTFSIHQSSVSEFKDFVRSIGGRVVS